MKYWEITFYYKDKDRSSYASYSGSASIARNTRDEAEEYAKQKKNRDYEIVEITKEAFDFDNSLD